MSICRNLTVGQNVVCKQGTDEIWKSGAIESIEADNRLCIVRFTHFNALEAVPFESLIPTGFNFAKTKIFSIAIRFVQILRYKQKYQMKMIMIILIHLVRSMLLVHRLIKFSLGILENGRNILEYDDWTWFFLLSRRYSRALDRSYLLKWATKLAKALANKIKV